MFLYFTLFYLVYEIIFLILFLYSFGYLFPIVVQKMLKCRFFMRDIFFLFFCQVIFILLKVIIYLLILKEKNYSLSRILIYGSSLSLLLRVHPCVSFLSFSIFIFFLTRSYKIWISEHLVTSHILVEEWCNIIVDWTHHLSLCEHLIIQTTGFMDVDYTRHSLIPNFYFGYTSSQSLISG